jgi:hypothetical protein
LQVFHFGHRSPAVRDIPEAVLPIREADQSLPGKLVQQLVAERTVNHRVGFLLVVEE